MIAAAFALILMQQAAPASTVVWHDAPPIAAEAPETPSVQRADVPEWGRTDPFAYERSQCSPMLRGATSLEACQADVRGRLYLALGETLPAALRPSGAVDDCQMRRDAAQGSPYAVQCGAPSREARAPAVPQEQDCRPRPERGGFSSECRRVDAKADKGLTLKLWGED